MTSLYRDLNNAVLAANLNKTQLLVFVVLSNQTIGYGKATDPLTDKRIAFLTGIRLDRVRVAIRAIVKKGLFDCQDHDQYDHQYSIFNWQNLPRHASGQDLHPFYS